MAKTAILRKGATHVDGIAATSDLPRATRSGVAMPPQTLSRPFDATAIDLGHGRPVEARGRSLSRIAAGKARSRLGILKEFVALRLGPGRLSFDEYVALRLYDDDFYAGADKEAFVGFKASQKIWLCANYRLDAFGLANNKIACDMLFAAHGFPVMPTIAIFRDGVGRDAPFLLRDEKALRGFLAGSEHYPLFGKPVSGQRSVGTASIERYDAERGLLVPTTGGALSLDSFVAQVKTHAASGYLFQKRVEPHPAIREICGNRLATVRLLTILTDSGPRLLRACWKIPGGPNAADNFWRPGNLLAQLDTETGRVLRVLQGDGPGLKEVTHHPESGVRIVDTIVPNWPAVTRLALDGARVLGDMPLIGWDIAPVDNGAIIVELNETPDFKLHQLADRRGIMDAQFARFLGQRRRHARHWLSSARRRTSKASLGTKDEKPA